MHRILAVLALTFAAALPAAAQLHISIGVNVPSYPTLQRIPNYPVYYAPNLRANYFFYDGLYWVFDGDEWYASSWYNGPWEFVDRYEVPTPVLHVPVRYYRVRPASFGSYRIDAAPRWDVYWGPTWVERRRDWQRWDVRRAPAPAPLPVYQRQYSRDRYPVAEQQHLIRSRNYRYEPRDAAAREVYREYREKVRDGRGPPDHAVAKGLRNRDEDGRGPPSHAVAKGVRNRDEGERGPPSHAMARGHDRDDDRGRGRGRDRDRDDHPGKGKGRDKD